MRSRTNVDVTLIKAILGVVVGLQLLLPDLCHSQARPSRPLNLLTDLA
ncbi:MAG: hypothetical protein PHR21_08185 [Oscillospiraceae bacterium]|nr:hypothetical protein [Oscillospiraceae bacterium]MDD4369406.1 hypothetical protein [Oscillospiraceae bacterium]